MRVTGQDQSDVGAGEIVALTHVRHGVEAFVDSVFLLTTVTSQAGDSQGGDPVEVSFAMDTQIRALRQVSPEQSIGVPYCGGVRIEGTVSP